jgi:hypothetical protein
VNNIVLIESPYRNGDRNRNLRYLAWCEFHSASMGETPIASHGNCTAYWPEDDEHRAKGFAWRDRIREVCDCVVFYTDLGMSEGQHLAEDRDTKAGVQCVRRCLPAKLLAQFEMGEYPPGSMRRIALLAATKHSSSDETVRETPVGWTRYKAVRNNQELGFPILRDIWGDVHILMELESKGYLRPSFGSRTIVREGTAMMISDPIPLLLTPVAC